MDVSTIGQLIGSLGFPIVVCGALFWMIVKNEASRREDNNKLSEAINNNTIALTKLATKIGGNEE